MAKARNHCNIMLRPEPVGGSTALAPALPGCVSYGRTIDEARDMPETPLPAISPAWVSPTILFRPTTTRGRATRRHTYVMVEGNGIRPRRADRFLGRQMSSGVVMD